MEARIIFSRLRIGIGCVLASFALPVWGQYGFPSGVDTRSRDANALGTQGFGWNFLGGGVDDSRAMQPLPAAPTWTLGVGVENSDRGVVVTRVQPGSPAAQSGINQGDVILAVGGYQVGYVDGRLYDVGDEIRRRVNQNGQVSMLTLGGRTGQLNLLSVALQQDSVVVRGTVFYRDRQALPQGAMLQVRIDNLTRPYVSASGDTRTTPIAQQQPIPFELYLNRQYLYSTDRYQIQAAIMYGNQVLYTTAQPIPVDVFSNQNNIQIELVNAQNSQVAQNPSYSVGYSPATSQEIVQYYQTYLRRQPSQRELQAWVDHVSRGRSKNDLPISLLSSPEFFEGLGNNNVTFVNQLFQLLASRNPSQAELNQWVRSLQSNGGNRLALVRDFYVALPRR